MDWKTSYIIVWSSVVLMLMSDLVFHTEVVKAFFAGICIGIVLLGAQDIIKIRWL